jgi:hypothetical protein
MASAIETNLQAYEVDEEFEGVGVDVTSTHRAEFWKQYALVNGFDDAAVFLNTLTCTNKKGIHQRLQTTRAAYARGIREAKTIVALRAKREAEEEAERQRERNAERNRKKRAARKRSKQQQA